MKYLESFDRQTRSLVKSLYSRDEVILTIKDIMLEISDEGFTVDDASSLNKSNENEFWIIISKTGLGGREWSFFYKEIQTQLEDCVKRIRKLIPHHDFKVKFRTPSGWTNGEEFPHSRINGDSMLYQILIQIIDL